MAQIRNINFSGYDSHVEITWDGSSETVEIYSKTTTDSTFKLRGETSEKYYLDFVTDLGRNINIEYKIVEKGSNNTYFGASSVSDYTDEQLLEMVQEYTFRYFWDFGDINTGLCYERSGGDNNTVTIGGSAFGLMTFIVGAERGWITREEAIDRLNKATTFLAECDRFHGMWAHWYYADSGEVKAFSKKDNGGDIVESAFMAQALLTIRQYFNQDTKAEKQLSERCTQLWEEMEWSFYTNGGKGLIWHWSPDYGFEKNHGIRGYNECLIAYVLAESHPKYAIEADGYHDVWAGWDNTNFANYREYYGMKLPLGNDRWMGGPLFFAHYSYLGLDPRNLVDQYANYWEQNKRQTLINRAYCIDNPYGHPQYGEDFWGITASDNVPKGYRAHAPGYMRDIGTIAPTAALSSMPYTPNESMDVLKNLYRNHGADVFGPYGFYDAINFHYIDAPEGHVRKNYIGIDQGPILLMIENHRSGLLWNYFMQNKDVIEGLQKLNFKSY